VLRHGRPKRGYIGIAGQAVQLAGAQRETAGADAALLVAGVVAGSPADQAGLLVGDVIVSFDGQAITSAESLLDAITGDRVGQSVTLRVLRGGKMTDVAVTVGERS
jgi:S1-C subfamily serine protease